MKVCNTEIMKEIKTLNDRKNDLINFETVNSTVTFLKDEDKTLPSYSYEEVTKELAEIDNRVLYLKDKLSYSNATTIVPEFNLTIASALTYLAILQSKKDRYYRLSLNDKLRRIGSNRDGQVEYTETLYEPSECKRIYEEIVEEINKLQMAIDRVNLTNSIEI